MQLLYIPVLNCLKQEYILNCFFVHPTVFIHLVLVSGHNCISHLQVYIERYIVPCLFKITARTPSPLKSFNDSSLMSLSLQVFRQCVPASFPVRQDIP